jgi:hypothetical protein
VFVERESLSGFESDKPIKLIMNGWFMRHPDKFPPSEKIEPLFVSFHLTPSIEQNFFSDENVEYLKKYSPIGCRDIGTLEMMRKHEIDAYFSGCLTLTLGYKYSSASKNGKVYFVDPYYEYGLGLSGWKKHTKTFLLMVKYWRKIIRFVENFNPEYIGAFYKISPLLNKWAMAACFYHTYSTYFSDEIIFKAEYINHQVPQTDFDCDDAKMKYAESLINKYSAASLVVTSRIHCALPCLGTNTPVLFVTSEKLSTTSVVRSSGRFGGLIDLLNVLSWMPNGLKAFSDGAKIVTHKGKCSLGNLPINPCTFEHLRDSLIKRVRQFLDEY